MTLNFPIGSSVYLILFFIDLPPLSPIPRTINADDSISIREPHGHDAVAHTANAIKPFLLAAMDDIFRNDTVRVKIY